MHITFVQPVYRPAIGGCELYSHQLLGHLQDRHSLQVITSFNSQEEKLAYPDLWRNCLLHARRGGEQHEFDGVPVHLISLRPWQRQLFFPVLRGHRRWERPAMALIERLLAAEMVPLFEKTDLVYAIHGGVSFLGCAAQRAARICGVPMYFTSVLHERHGWDDELKLIGEDGKPGLVGGAPYIKKIPGTYHDRYWGELVKTVDGVIAWTEHEKKILIREGVAAERIHVTGIGPTLREGGPSRLELRQRHGIGDEPVVLFLGRKHELKGIAEILEASGAVWQRHPDTKFVFVGPAEGSTEEILARYANDPRVLNLPPVSDAVKSSWFSACDVFVNPSLHESFGIAFLEAWVAGRPIVGGDIPPVREISGNGEAGILVSGRSPAHIADGLIRLLADREYADRLGRIGQERVRTRYSWERIAELTERAFGVEKTDEPGITPGLEGDSGA